MFGAAPVQMTLYSTMFGAAPVQMTLYRSLPLLYLQFVAQTNDFPSIL
jgi:hypothetical protein